MSTMHLTGNQALVDASDWKQRLERIVDTVREMSAQTDPQAMVRAYGQRMRAMMPTDRMVAISRRGIEPPRYRITRSNLWSEQINPWTQAHRLPLHDRGLLSELLYADVPRIIDDIDLPHGDPAAEYFDGMRSLIALPLFDQGVAMNMVVFMRKERAAFDPEKFPDQVLTGNLFGRATHNLVLAHELREAYDLVDRELQGVAALQRSLLPAELPKIPTMDLAAYYQTSRRAGGDYYDFFPLPEDRWGMLIADVSGHGTPAAVLMAITRSLAHSYPGSPQSPPDMLAYLNHRLSTDYTTKHGAFVTAFYAVYDPRLRSLIYSSAGHHPGRVKRCSDGSVLTLDGAQSLPLGITEDADYHQAAENLRVGDQLVLYTDGITEASAPDGRLFGLDNLDRVLENCSIMASGLIASVVGAVDAFTGGAPPDDDRTLLVAKIS